MSHNLKAKILETASELFYSQGIKATGVETIVKAAGTTKMTLYKHFPAKDDLIIAFLRKRDADFTSWFVEQVNSKAQQPKDQLLAIFDIIGLWLDIPQFRGCAFINASAEFPVENNPVQQVSAEFYQKFRDYIADLARQAGAEHPDNLAQQLALLIEGAIVSEQMKRGGGASVSARQAAEILINVAVPGSSRLAGGQ
ncbi:TetR/AcrR family transcriptional regulator [Methylomonas paludis]|uniref:TetR/AcrR family transcriptional regulator n=1 Tax=Methylomonas paludis TaxID=1173101 RepID=A0A975MLP3_9GAMM|nr:TetR/AcrR family transcriptional regulator [Methylomonas paludis]QWF69855.1 TetR/AcrR family transcriptional regulator [Methylomonas paludis]